MHGKTGGLVRPRVESVDGPRLSTVPRRNWQLRQDGERTQSMSVLLDALLGIGCSGRN